MKKKGGQIREKQTRRKFIRKGHSSDDNPEQKKFRLAAQTTFFTKNTGPSNLTTDALLKHDAQDSGNTKGSDAQSEGGLTFQSWSSHWTDCTNKTFGSVSGLWNSQSALHKEILAVLAAVTETIQESEGGKESETAYFAALMTTLESMEDVTSAAAVAYLLSLAIKRVPEPVLKSRFSTASKIVTDSLNKFIEQGSTTLIKSLIKVLSYLLRVQDQATWADSSTLLCYDLLLAMTVYKHPKVRNNAHQGVCAVMKGSSLMKLPNKPMYHPAAKSTAEYCISKLNTRTIDSNKVVDKEKHYILTVLRSVMQCFSAPFIKTSVESILQIMAPGDNVLNATAMSTLHAFFQSSVPEKSLPAKMNAKIITALYDFQPSENDVQPSLAWITVMEANHLHLHKLDEQLCRSHIKRLISTCMKILQSDRKQICTCSENTIKKILAECVKPSMKNVKKGGENVPSSNSIKQYLQEIFQMVEAGLGYQYHKNWDNVLRLLAHCYMIFGKEHSCFMIKSLVSLVNMRDDHFAYTEQSNEAYGAAVRYWGPKCVLEAVPLDIKVDDHDYSRSWMLPVLTEYVRNTELAFFISYFMPLAAMYKTKEEVCAEANDDTNERVYRVLHLQVWRLLPSFCTSTTDIPQSFKNIAKTMGMMIQDDKVLRTAVMSALRKLVDHSVHKDDARASMMNFSKNFIPLLLNLYNDDAAEEHRVPIATTIKTYLQVASPELVKTLFSKCYGKLADDSTPVDQRPPLLDVMKLLVGALDQDDLVTILEYAIDNMTTDNIRVQKKTYRILEYVMFLKSKKAQSVVQEHFDTIKTNLISSVSKAKAPSKAARLICLKHIIQLTDQPNKEFLNDIIPEVIMCTKEIAARSRNAAYILLVEIGEAMIKWSDTREEAITEYLTLLMAGFGGGPTLVTATIHAVNRVVHEFKADISCDMVEQLFDSCCLLMQSKIKQISTAALSFVKVLLVAFDIEVGRQHLRNVVDSLIIMKMKHHPRFIIKELFTRLVRKYSVECIRPLVPENEHIMINSVVKALNLQKKKKTKQHLLAKYGSETPRENTEKKKTETFDEMLEDTDSEPEDDDKKSRMKNRKIAISKRKKQEFGSYLKEDGEDGNIIDFLDPEASKQVSATRPVQKANKRGADSNRGFKTSSDGRLVITETEDEKQFSKKRRAQDDDDDDLDELLDAMNHYKKRPKIKFGCEDLDKADYKSSYAESYRTGGTGIHRPLNKKQKTGGGAQASKTLTGEAYKSTKAGGDVKRKNMPDPYAYVPLRNQILNKRKQAKLKGQFKGLVKGAKKGAKAGKDMRAKRK